MKRFLILSLIFTCVVFLCDYILSMGLSKLVPIMQYDRRLERIISGTDNSDIVITGSSRGARNLLAGKMSDELGVEVYNYSYPGSNVDFHEYIISSILKNEKKPSIVILSIDYVEVVKNETINFRLDKLYPLSGYDYVYETILSREEVSPSYGLLFQSRKYANNFPKSLYARLYIESTDTISEHGSMPLTFKSLTYDTLNYENSEDYDVNKEDSVLTLKYMSILKMCKQNNIKVILVDSPNYTTKQKGFKERITELSLKVFDSKDDQIYYFDVAYTDKSLFYDRNHLDEKGATIFTEDLIKYIKSTPELIESLRK